MSSLDWMTITEAEFRSLSRSQQVAVLLDAFRAMPIIRASVRNVEARWQTVKEAQRLATDQLQQAAKEDYVATWPELERWARDRGRIA